MNNCTLNDEKKDAKINGLVEDLEKKGVKAEKSENGTVVITIGRKDGKGSFFEPLNTAKMKSGKIVTDNGSVNLCARKFSAKLAEPSEGNQVIAKPICCCESCYC